MGRNAGPHEIAPEIEPFEIALDAFRAGAIESAELACHYVVSRVLRAHGGRAIDGARNPVLRSRSERPVVRLLAEKRFHRLTGAVPSALVAWADGARSVELRFDVPTPREVLFLQARGRRCVSLLADGIPTAPHEDGLAFAVHDLCHLEKLVDPAHYAGQVGFFASMERALATPAMNSLEAMLDPDWPAERDRVLADMNGSPVFLFLVMKGKLKIAVRKRAALDSGEPSRPNRPLEAGEERAIDEAFDILAVALGLHGAARDAARALSNKSGGHDAQMVIAKHFEAVGNEAIATTARLV